MRYRTIKYRPAFLKGVETLSVVFFKISSRIFENVRSNKPSSVRHFFGQKLLTSKAT